MMNPPSQYALTQAIQNAANLAADIADHITAQSIDFAQTTHCSGELSRRDSLALAAIHAGIAAQVYAVNELTAAIREVTPEIAGAISEAGTDIGAGLVQGLGRITGGE